MYPQILTKKSGGSVKRAMNGKLLLRTDQTEVAVHIVQENWLQKIEILKF